MNQLQTKEYVDLLIAQRDNMRKNIIQLSIYSNGSVRLEDIFMIPISDLETIEKSITEKIKLDKGIKTQDML